MDSAAPLTSSELGFPVPATTARALLLPAHLLSPRGPEWEQEAVGLALAAGFPQGTRCAGCFTHAALFNPRHHPVRKTLPSSRPRSLRKPGGGLRGEATCGDALRCMSQGGGRELGTQPLSPYLDCAERVTPLRDWPALTCPVRKPGL